MRQVPSFAVNNVLDFARRKQSQEKITMVSAYDYWSAHIIAHTSIDCILVGDSASMVMHGHKTTVSASIEMLLPHIQAVARGAPNKFIIGDMPFCSYRKGLENTMHAVDLMMKAGSHAIKLEGADDNIPIIQHMIRSGVPVMGHLGLTPQSVNALGGFKVQGKDDSSARNIIDQAKSLEDAGCFGVVLECVPYRLAKEISEQLSIPTIGIGAGPYTDGQVLVFHDLLGLDNNRKPKFLKRYLAGFELVQNALNEFDRETKAIEFPALEEHCY